jgi:hypothetical protein
MRKYKSTMVELVQELEAIEPRTRQIAFIIDEAKRGEYHDYKNQKYVCGKVAVSGALRAIGLVELAKRVENGEFDEEPDEEDKNMLTELLKEMIK